MAQWLERKFTDRKVRGSNPISAPRLPLSRLGQPGMDYGLTYNFKRPTQPCTDDVTSIGDETFAIQARRTDQQSISAPELPIFHNIAFKRTVDSSLFMSRHRLGRRKHTGLQNDHSRKYLRAAFLNRWQVYYDVTAEKLTTYVQNTTAFSRIEVSKSSET
ncbi:hypothetical protein CSKR_103236 [Clonorchis sinensis]|uniref:Uncharacterized protein n=1 Tax=Clonorchis sinensis TaxID=79923 RepID=A0A419PCZ8_CLOSI|nr:hypothetical protein CSKR_103236 [Clonorchis sinensis]